MKQSVWTDNPLTMLSVIILRRLRPCNVSQFFRNIHSTATRDVASFNAFCLRGLGEKPLHGDRRSFLNLNNKVQSHFPLTRCLSVATHSEDGNLIYTGSLGIAVRGVKLFSYSTSGASLLLMPHILLKTGLVAQSVTVTVAFCGIIGFFTFLTPVILHLITKGYVIRLYHNPDRDTYTAITYNVILTEKKSVFHQRQVRIPTASKMFTTFYAGKMGLLVNPDLFPIPHDYNHLMGYDRPFSFDTDNIDRSDKN